MSILNNIRISFIIPENLLKNIEFYHLFSEKSLLFVTNDDKVFGIGENSFGKLGFAHNQELTDCEEVIELRYEGIKQFFDGNDFVLGLSSDNKLFSWGMNKHGQLGRSVEHHLASSGHLFKPGEVKIPLGEKIKQVTCANHRAMALTESGKMFIWGWNFYGWIRNPFDISNYHWTYHFYIQEPTQLKPLDKLKVKSVHCFEGSLFAITANNKVFSWGTNEHHCLGHKNDTLGIYSPKLIKDLPEIIQVANYQTKTYFLSKDGKLYFCGDHQGKSIKEPILMESEQNIIKLERISEYVLVLNDEKVIYELNELKLTKTDFNSFEEFSLERCKFTDKTVATRIFNSHLDLNTVIGSGGFGRVYQVSFQRKMFALKKLQIESMPKILNDKNNELEIMKQLNSDFVVKLYDYWTKSEHGFQFLYIQMELCDEDLKKIIQLKIEVLNNNHHADFIISCEIFKQSLEAIDYLHSEKIIHRDIKPSNVLIKYDNEHAHLKLCDFGLSKVIEKESQTNTSSIGTLRYRAPEISSNKYNEKVDIFSLGITAQELFSLDKYNQTKLFIEDNVRDKLKNLQHLINDMIHGNSSLRPSARDILAKKEEWHHNKQESDITQLHNHVDSDLRFLKFLNK